MAGEKVRSRENSRAELSAERRRVVIFPSSPSATICQTFLIAQSLSGVQALALQSRRTVQIPRDKLL